MRVVAVIPARAGSKGIPNKNIRLLNGKPMIYYAIQNAITSTWITDIIVTTDSMEIKAVADNMGVAVRWRAAELCRDEVTLDTVVYDAVSEINCDYVVTLQPTSPTLKSETLDGALEHAINNNFDTVISVVNRPHLAWRKDGNRKVPAYAARLNRQQLPPYYLEAGAFVISKRLVISSASRIGEKLDVYEVPLDEAIDVDTFSDLREAEYLLRNTSVAIYVNGNNNRGTGHIYRAIELADEMYGKPDIFFDINQTDIALFGNVTHSLIPVNGINVLFEILREKKYTIFINDILDTSLDYMIALRNCMPATRIVNFEDDGEGAGAADLVINSLYEKPTEPHMKVGEKYYICPKLFMIYDPISIRENVESVFISFGGADPLNYTDRMLKIIASEEYRKLRFLVVLGRAKSNVEELMAYNLFDNIEVIYDACNMPQLMSGCDIAFTSRGRTAYELAMLGIPTVSMAQNEREALHTFINDNNGFAYLGINPNDETIKSTLDYYIVKNQAERQRLSSMLLASDLRGGRRRVRRLLDELADA